MQNSIFKTFIFTLLLLFAWTQVFAQSFDQDAVSARQTTIANIAKQLEGTELNIANSRETLRTIRVDVEQAIALLEKQQSEIKSQLDSIGPVPESGQSETADVESRRKKLMSESSDTAALLAQAKLNAADANSLLNTLNTLQRNAFVSETFRSSRSPFTPQFWQDFGTGFASLKTNLGTHITQTKGQTSSFSMGASDYVRAIIGLVLTLFAFNPLRRVFDRFVRKTYQIEEPAWEHRFLTLVFQILSRVIPAFVGGFLLYRLGIKSGLITSNYIPVVKNFSYVLLLSFTAAGVAKAVLDPASEAWRIIPINNSAAKIASLISIFAVALWGLDQTVFQIALLQTDFGPLANVSSFLLTVVTAVLIWTCVKKVKWSLLPKRSDEISQTVQKRWKMLSAFGLPLAGLMIIASTLGYLNFARLLSGRTVLVIGLILGIWLCRKSIILGLQSADKRFFPVDPSTSAPSSHRSIHFWAGLMVDALIAVAVVPIFLLMIGREGLEVKAWMQDAFTGISIGKFTLSISDIIAALLTFFIIITVTRFLQRSLDARLFSKGDSENGFRNSFRTLLGYVGLILAVFAAIGIIGLDLSNLTIIAGALSVGIGFGLQSIVNNFVSGLILLFERPVKVGDWVVTSSGEGFIKNISVRSTEIETFDRASIIIPNSELISSSVTNWTHKDKSGRVIIPVGVSYTSDAKKVRDVLLTLAKDNTKILKYPEPIVYFKDFGSSSLDLELRFFIKNVADGPIVKNNLRFDILEAFRDNDIEIPFPQSDVTIKNWEVKP